MADKRYKAGVLGGVTQEQANAKNVEVATPMSEAPTSSPTMYDNYMGSVASMLQANADAVARANEAEQQRLNELKALREKQGSFIANYFTQSEPKIDKDKERRLQQAAKIKLLHDGLSALAKGFPAFAGRNAMGYYPESTPSTIGKDIEELNAMRDAYVKERKAWRELGEKQKVAEMDAQITEAEAALKTAQEARTQALKNYQASADDYHRGLLSLAEEQRADARAEARNRATIQASYNRRNSGDGGEVDKADMYAAVGFLETLYPDMFEEIVETTTPLKGMRGEVIGDETSTRKQPRKLTEDDRWQLYYDNKALWDAVKRGMKHGYSKEDIIEVIQRGYDITKWTDDTWESIGTEEKDEKWWQRWIGTEE